MLQQITYQSKKGYSNLPTMRFDTNSFLIGVDSFTSVMMVTQPDQFEDLILDEVQSVQGIGMVHANVGQNVPPITLP